MTYRIKLSPQPPRTPTRRTRVKLWHILYDISVGGMLLTALLAVLGLAALWVWGVTFAPPSLAWPLRGAALLLALWGVGHWARGAFR